MGRYRQEEAEQVSAKEASEKNQETIRKKKTERKAKE
jgi:hypothetical protein